MREKRKNFWKIIAGSAFFAAISVTGLGSESLNMFSYAQSQESALDAPRKETAKESARTQTAAGGKNEGKGSASWESQVEIMAHRGNWLSGVPENTLPAFENAIESGADWIELDVNLTKDGSLVVVHDGEITLPSGEKKKVVDMTLGEVKGLCANAHLGPAYQNVGIPTLKETLAFCKNRIRLNIELKNVEAEVDAVARDVAALIKEQGMEGQCMVSSYSYPLLERIKHYDAEVETGLISSEPLNDFTQYTAADNFMLSIEQIDIERVKKIHGLGKKVSAWTVNDRYSVQKCKEAGTDYLITDYPETILSL